MQLQGVDLNQFPSLRFFSFFFSPCAPFHYFEHTSCIVTTTNFLAVYKTVNHNHTAEGKARRYRGRARLCGQMSASARQNNATGPHGAFSIAFLMHLLNVHYKTFLNGINK